MRRRKRHTSNRTRMKQEDTKREKGTKRIYVLKIHRRRQSKRQQQQCVNVSRGMKAHTREEGGKKTKVFSVFSRGNAYIPFLCVRKGRDALPAQRSQLSYRVNSCVLHSLSQSAYTYTCEWIPFFHSSFSRFLLSFFFFDFHFIPFKLLLFYLKGLL